MRAEVVRFLEAQARLEDASAMVELADERFHTVQDEHEAAWGLLTEEEREAVNDACAVLRAAG